MVSGAAADMSLEAGDKLMVGVARTDDASLDHGQIVVVDKTWVAFGLRYVKTKGTITCLDKPFVHFRPLVSIFGGERTITSAGELRAYKIAQSFRHFGHAAPPMQVGVDANGHPQAQTISYDRAFAGATTSSVSPSLAALEMPLDGDTAAITAGTTLLTEAPFIFTGAGGRGFLGLSRHERVVAREITAVAKTSLAWGSQTGGSTVLTLDATLAIKEGSATAVGADIRNISFHQVDGDAFALTAAPQPIAAAGGNELSFYGADADAAALDGRTVLIAGPGDTLTETQASFVGTGASAGFHRINLDRQVNYADFDYDAPTVTVYGNLVTATEGKTGDQVTLGDGDARQTFQTFALPKPPLTYLLAPTSDPPQAPELSVYVAGRRWTRVDFLLHLLVARPGLCRARGCRRHQLRAVRRRQDGCPAAERPRQRHRTIPHRQRQRRSAQGRRQAADRPARRHRQGFDAGARHRRCRAGGCRKRARCGARAHAEPGASG